MNLQYRKKNRWELYDYSTPGMYFVTICTKNKKNWFGEIKNGEMVLSDIGKIAKDCWSEIPRHYEGVVLDSFVVMPNHIHGIIQIGYSDIFGHYYNSVGDADRRPLRNGYDRSKMLLSKIINAYKSSCTGKIHFKLNNYDFKWQRSFYDHIIRNEKSLFKFQTYIYNNPINWQIDIENAKNPSIKSAIEYYRKLFNE